MNWIFPPAVSCQRTESSTLTFTDYFKNMYSIVVLLNSTVVLIGRMGCEHSSYIRPTVCWFTVVAAARGVLSIYRTLSRILAKAAPHLAIYDSMTHSV